MRFALICYSTKDKQVRRYVRNPHGKVWMTHEADVLEITEDTPGQLEAFRVGPTDFCLQVNTAGAAA